MMHARFPRALVVLMMAALAAGCSKDNPVNPGPTDMVKPVVSILSPQQNQLVRADSLVFEADASDSVGVVRVEFVVDAAAAPIATVTKAPWRAAAPVKTLGAGTHTVVACAYDAAGNKGTSAPVTFVWRSGEMAWMSFRDGARFVYDRWDLDENNQRDETTKGTYTTVVSKNDGTSLDGRTDWFFMISRDSRFSRRDTLQVRTGATGDLQSYGFVSRLLRRFINSAGSYVDPSTVVIPAPTWDVVGRFNADAGTPLPLGSTWDITPAAGVNLSVLFSGFPLPLTVNIKIQGKLESRGETVIVGGRTIAMWKVKMTVTISVLTSKSTLVINAWFSDDPSGQIRMIQESGVLTILTQSVAVPGDEQELVSFTE